MSTLDKASRKTVFSIRDYDLNATFASGQAFRWQCLGNAWEGVIGERWVRLRITDAAISAETSHPQRDWSWLREYLQIDGNLAEVLQTFPDDKPMRDSVAACRGLRLLRQEPWECLASFILSSTKQISQIREIVRLLTERFGLPVCTPFSNDTVRAFPTAARVAACSEQELRACKMGFRAPYLLKTAQMIASGSSNLEDFRGLALVEARARLMLFPGVGRKIADCVLLFAYGFPQAFPVDVWVMRALRELYFSGSRKVTPRELLDFSELHFGPNGGYAQQYLFHYMRTKNASNKQILLPRSTR